MRAFHIKNLYFEWMLSQKRTSNVIESTAQSLVTRNVTTHVFSRHAGDISFYFFTLA